MENFPERLSTATARIRYLYFKLPIDGGEAVFRERVYCYELYHQLRLVMSDQLEYVINGEVDKLNHPRFADFQGGYPKPDFLVHVPGDMSKNHIVIEVKSQKVSAQGLRNDLIKLDQMVHRARYTTAIYLIYGHDLSERYFMRLVKACERYGITAEIQVWFHTGPESPAEMYGILNRQTPRAP